MGQNKKLGLGSGIAVCIGLIVATSCLLSLGQLTGLAGKSFIIPLAVVVILNSFIAFSFAELNDLMPKVDGGVGQYTLVGLGPFASIISNVAAYVITMILASAVELTMCGLVLNSFMPGIPATIISVVILVVLTCANFFGIDIFSKIQNVVVVLLIGSLVVLGVLGFFELGTGTPIVAAQQSTPSVVGIGGVMGLSALAFWLFIGVEFVIPVAKDLKNPKRNVLLSMVLALVILFVVQGVLGCGMANYVNLDILASDALPHMVYAEALLGPIGKIWMGFVTLLASVSTFNTVIVSSARILEGMSQEKMAPKTFQKLNKNNVPVIGLVFISGIVALLILIGYTSTNAMTTLILAASCFWLVSYILTHITVLVLKKRNPDIARRKFLTFLGLPQIIGILGNIYMIWNISSDPDARMTIFKTFGVILAILVVYAFIWVKYVMKMNLFKSISLKVVNENALKFEAEKKKALKKATETI